MLSLKEWQDNFAPGDCLPTSAEYLTLIEDIDNLGQIEVERINRKFSFIPMSSYGRPQYPGDDSVFKQLCQERDNIYDAWQSWDGFMFGDYCKFIHERSVRDGK